MNNPHNSIRIYSLIKNVIRKQDSVPVILLIMDLSGKSVIVTGGNVGIGRPTALELARLGANVTIIGRNEATCSEAVNEIIESTSNQKVSLDSLT